MKKMIKLSTAVLASVVVIGTAHAATPGGYVGIGLGASKLNTPTDNSAPKGATSFHSTSKRGGLGGQLFGGYNFNQYFGIEAGYITYANSTNKVSASDDITTVNGSAKYSLNALDIVGKVYLPLGENFNLYALGGMARVSGTTKVNASSGTVSISESKTVHKVRPMYGVGASYNFTQHVSTAVEFSQIRGSGNMKTSSKATPTASLLSLNLAYNFG